MNIFKKFIIIFSLITFYPSLIMVDTPFFLDFKYILNKSDAGKENHGDWPKKWGTST